MSKVENFLLNINPKNKKISLQKKDNFLLNLITNLKDSKKLLSLLKNMNITKKELNNLLEKNIPIEIKEKIKTLIKEENILNYTILQNILVLNKPISNNILEKTINNNSSLKKEIVKITKKIIDSKIKLNKIILNEKEIKEFREIKTFKELINFANKKELNISKIVISSFNLKTNNKIDNIILPTNIVLDKKMGNQNIINSNLTNKFSHLILNNQKEGTNTHTNPQQNIINSSITINDLLKNSFKTDTQFINTSKNKNNLNLDNKTDTNLLLFNTSKKNDTSKISLEALINNSKKNSEESFNNMLSTNQIALNELKLNIIKAKETIRYFSNSLKEAIENYKPPISKISIGLNPKELGKVEVTLIHRGDNLQIQINSNNNAISLFNYNQQELRHNLINMGFSYVNMSFNQQNQQQKGNKEYQQNQNFKQKDEDELIIEIPYQYA